MVALSIHYSEATNEMLSNDIDTQISYWSQELDLDERMVRAIIQTESAFQPWAIRVEPHLKRTRWYTNAVPEKFSSNEYAYCSMGLMQVLYGVAVGDYGFKGEPIALMEPSNAIKYGCMHLSRLKKRFPDGVDYIAAYNQGNNRKGTDGKYNNQQYVDKVLRNYDAIRD